MDSDNTRSSNETVPTRLEGKFQATAVCCFLGLGFLMAWNSMLTIGDYYYNVFPDYHPSRVLPMVYEPFAIGTIIALSLNESKINTRKRIISGYIIFTIGSFLLVILDIATKGRGGIGPYIGICAIMACFGVADALVQGGMVGDLSFMCPKFMQSFMAGLGVAGVLTSCLRFITKAIFNRSHDGLRNGALMFLGISAFIQFLCTILYAFVFPKLPIVKHYRAKAASEGSKTVSADLAAAGLRSQAVQSDESNIERLTKKQLLLQNIDYAIDLFLIFTLSLSIFPGFLYENTGEHKLGEWYALVLVASYNAGNLVSRYVPLIKCLTMQSRKGILGAVLARVLLAPAFYFTAKYGDQGWMIFLTSVLGLTNGYLTVCVLTEAPKGYKGPEANALGNILVVFMTGGMVAGICLGWLWLIGKNSF